MHPAEGGAARAPLQGRAAAPPAATWAGRPGAAPPCRGGALRCRWEGGETTRQGRERDPETAQSVARCDGIKLPPTWRDLQLQPQKTAVTAAVTFSGYNDSGGASAAAICFRIFSIDAIALSSSSSMLPVHLPVSQPVGQ